MTKTRVKYDNNVMRKRSLVGKALLFFSVALPLFSAQAAIHVVGPGDSLQAAITGAAEGDTIRLAAGSYTENINLTKGLTIIPASTNEATVAGHWNISNIPTRPVRLGAFRITGTLTANNVADIALADMKVSSSVNYTGCGWQHKGTTSGSITVNNCDTTLYDSRVNGTLSHTAVSNVCNVSKCVVTGNLKVHKAQSCTVFQCRIDQYLELYNLKEFWVGYSSMRYVPISNGGEGALVGCHIDGNDLSCHGLLYVTGNTSVSVRNCTIEDSRTSVNKNYDLNQYGNGILASGSGVYVDVANCVIRDLFADNQDRYPDRYMHNSANGVCVISGARCSVVGSIIYGGNDDGTGSGRSVYGNDKVSVQYSCIQNWEGGVAPVNCITRALGDVGFVDYSDYALKSTSPCIDRGAPVTIYDDHDGSRNDMGCWGGHDYSPDGWTTPLPVVIATKALPDAVMHGEKIKVEAHGVVSGN